MIYISSKLIWSSIIMHGFSVVIIIALILTLRKVQTMYAKLVFDIERDLVDTPKEPYDKFDGMIGVGSEIPTDISKCTCDREKGKISMTCPDHGL